MALLGPVATFRPTSLLEVLLLLLQEPKSTCGVRAAYVLLTHTECELSPDSV